MLTSPHPLPNTHVIRVFGPQPLVCECVARSYHPQSMPFIGDLDLSKVHLTPMVTEASGRKKVDIYMDASSTKSSNRLNFQLCPDEDDAMTTRYGLDKVRDDDKDPTRRGLLCIVSNEAAIRSLKALDGAVVAYAVANSKELFKKVLTEEQILLRYKPIIAHEKDDENLPYVTKFKIKCTGAVVPTKIFRITGPGTSVRSNEEALTHSGSRVVPVVSAYALWFMAGDAQFGFSFQAENMLVDPASGPSDMAAFVTKRPMTVEKEVEEPEVKRVKVELVDDDKATAM